MDSMNAFLSVFSLYIQVNTGMPAIPVDQMPYVEQVPVCDMVTIFEGPQAPCDLKGVHVGALYIVMQNKIMMPDDTDLSKPRDMSILVHELVHAQQQNDPRMFAASCIERELQAYTIQMKWIADVAKENPSEVTGLESAQQGAILSCAGKQGP